MNFWEEFYNSLGDYDKLFKVIDKYLLSSDVNVHKDLMFYLYLLGFKYRLLKPYYSLVSNLSFADIKLDDNSFYDNVSLQNDIRYSAYNHKFVNASKLLMESKDDLYKQIMNYLFEMVIVAQKKRNSYIEGLILASDINGLKKYFKGLKSSCFISKTERMMGMVVRDIKHLMEGQVFECSSYSNDLFSAIKGHNYGLALKYSYNDNLYMLLKWAYSLSNVPVNLSFESLLKSNMAILNRDRLVLIDAYDADGFVNYVNCKDNLQAFAIDYGGKKSVVLHYVVNRGKPSKKLYDDAYVAYKNGDYELFYNYYVEALEYADVKPFVYMYLGLQNLRWHNIPLAKSFLKVATCCDPSLDFSKILSSSYDDDMFGLSCINDVFSMYRDGISIDDIFARLNLSFDDHLLVLLIMAREFYKASMFNMGDRFLNMVKKCSNKSKFVNYYMHEVMEKKKFYASRFNVDNSMVLVLKV